MNLQHLFRQNMSCACQAQYKTVTVKRSDLSLENQGSAAAGGWRPHARIRWGRARHAHAHRVRALFSTLSDSCNAERFLAGQTHF